MRGSSKRSSDNEANCQYHSIYCPSDIYLYPSSYKVDKEILDDTYSLTNITVVEDEHEFVPRVVHLELIEGGSEGHEDCKDLIPSFLHVKLLEGAIGSDDEYEDLKSFMGMMVTMRIMMMMVTKMMLIVRMILN